MTPWHRPWSGYFIIASLECQNSVKSTNPTISCWFLSFACLLLPSCCWAIHMLFSASVKTTFPSSLLGQLACYEWNSYPRRPFETIVHHCVSGFCYSCILQSTQAHKTVKRYYTENKILEERKIQSPFSFICEVSSHSGWTIMIHEKMLIAEQSSQ